MQLRLFLKPLSLKEVHSPYHSRHDLVNRHQLAFGSAPGVMPLLIALVHKRSLAETHDSSGVSFEIRVDSM